MSYRLHNMARGGHWKKPRHGVGGGPRILNEVFGSKFFLRIWGLQEAHLWLKHNMKCPKSALLRCKSCQSLNQSSNLVIGATSLHSFTTESQPGAIWNNQCWQPNCWCAVHVAIFLQPLVSTTDIPFVSMSVLRLCNSLSNCLLIIYLFLYLQLAN